MVKRVTMTTSRTDLMSCLFVLMALLIPMRMAAEDGMIIMAGTGESGFSGDNGPARVAQVSSPGAMMVDDKGNVFFVEGERQRSGSNNDNRRVRRIDGQTRIITTVEKPDKHSVPSNRVVRKAGLQ